MKIIKQLSFLLLITLFVVNPAFSQESPAPLKNKKVDSKIIKKVPKEETKPPSKLMKATEQVDLSGCWQNSFGSIVLLSHDLNTGEITGKYSSTTGSSGVYYVRGYTNPDASENIPPVSLTIPWRTIVKDTDSTTLDNSQYWTSIMSGNYVPSRNSLALMNVISSAIEFKEVGITEPGNYPESLEFKKHSSYYPCGEIEPDSKYYNGLADSATLSSLSNSLLIDAGFWSVYKNISLKGEFSQKINFHEIEKNDGLKEFAKVSGTIITNKDQSQQFKGEVSYLTEGGNASLSIAYQDNDGNVVSLSGVLNTVKKTLELIEINSQGIEDLENIYMANRMYSHTYKSFSTTHN